MSKIDTFNIAPEDQEAFFKYLRWGNRYINSRIITKERPLSRRGTEEVIDVSLLEQISVLWYGLTEGERTAWQSAGSWSGQTGYALFVQDTSYRIKNGLSGLATPNDYHQYKVTRMTKETDYFVFSITQYHYNEYYLVRKITGSQNMLEPVFVEEYISFPFFLRFNMKSALLSFDPAWVFKAHVSVEYFVGGVQNFQETDLDLPLMSDWDYYELEVPDPGYPCGTYTVTLYSWYTQGHIDLDGIEISHSSQNWAFDPNCDNVENEHPNFGDFYIPSNWANNLPGSSTTLMSIYPT